MRDWQGPQGSEVKQVKWAPHSLVRRDLRETRETRGSEGLEARQAKRAQQSQEQLD